MTGLFSSLGVGALCLCSAMGSFSLVEQNPRNAITQTDSDTSIRVKELSSSSSYLYNSTLSVTSSKTLANGDPAAFCYLAPNSFPKFECYNAPDSYIVFSHCPTSDFLHNESSFGSLTICFRFQLEYLTSTTSDSIFSFGFYLQYFLDGKNHSLVLTSASIKEPGNYSLTFTCENLDCSDFDPSINSEFIFYPTCTRDICLTFYGASILSCDTPNSGINWDNYYQGYYKRIETNYNSGYDAGYSAGDVSAKSTYSGISNIVPNIFGSVVGFIDKVGSIEIFGVSLISILSIIVGGGLIALIVKLFLK